MNKHIIMLAAALLPFGLAAQNLNPEVQVTNEYQTRMGDASKLGPDMKVPDSLLRFDYHFDYSVFDSPYKGSYEFSPYSVTITPEARPYDGRKLYLRGGLGYTFKPELDLVWAAVDKKRSAVNVFASGNGYYGNYRHIVPGSFELAKKQFDKGWDFGTSVGADARFNIKDFVIRAEAGYDGIYTGHEIYHRDNCHAPYVSARLAYGKQDSYILSLGAHYRHVYDWLNGQTPVRDNEFKIDATLTPFVSTMYNLSVDVNWMYTSFYSAFSMHPHALFRMGKVDFDAGARLGWFTGQLTAHPALTATLHLFKDYFDIYAGADGQDHMMTYWDYKSRAHRYYATYGDPRPVREIADLFLGFRGHADIGLQYDFRAGYRFMKDAPFWAISTTGHEALYFQDCNILHVDALLAWASERFNLDGGIHYVNIPAGVDEAVFAPSAVTGTVKGTYNWNKRIYAGLSVDMGSSRKARLGGTTPKMPGYVNVGLYGEYKYNHKLSFWLKGDNLLGHDIRISPLISECGPSVIVGASLSL
ncbi:MAG: hypothetical protein J6O51_08590 [Bacteroidales bacterium]|nr:hypothetical protein [Bacteroidales bacterium]